MNENTLNGKKNLLRKINFFLNFLESLTMKKIPIYVSNKFEVYNKKYNTSFNKGWFDFENVKMIHPYGVQSDFVDNFNNVLDDLRTYGILTFESTEFDRHLGYFMLEFFDETNEVLFYLKY